MTSNCAFMRGSEADEAKQIRKLRMSWNNQQFPNFLVTSKHLNFTPIRKVFIFFLRTSLLLIGVVCEFIGIVSANSAQSGL